MALPYEESSAGEKALGEIQKILQAFGCQSFGSMMDFEKRVLLVQFKYRGQQVTLECSAAGYAAAWLRAHPYKKGNRATAKEWEAKALKIANTAVYSVLRDLIKGQVTAVECGLLSFEGAFLGQILLPSGKTFLQHATEAKLLQIGGAA